MSERPTLPLYYRVELAAQIVLSYGPDEDGYHETWTLTEDEKRAIVAALQARER